jgi:GDP-4-dehydro-6-deoxy-D-mannose reductase
MSILITGVTGFAGGHLAEYLAQNSARELHGLCRQAAWPHSLVHLEDKIRLHPCDLTDTASIGPCLERIAPDEIYHLAGYAHAGQSFREAEAAWNGNWLATRRLYDAIEAWGGKCRILFVGSGLVYGHPDAPNHAHDENCPLLPANPYASSKSAADLMSYQYTRFPGLYIVRARPFNHIGPRQSPQFAVAHFAKQIAAIERGEQSPVLETGNLTAMRDFTDVRDVVRAYVLLMEQGENGEVYNIATGLAHSMQEVVDRLLELARCPIKVSPQPRLMRAAEMATVRGNSSKLRLQTGWEPAHSFDQTLQDTLSAWRQRP